VGPRHRRDPCPLTPSRDDLGIRPSLAGQRPRSWRRGAVRGVVLHDDLRAQPPAIRHRQPDRRGPAGPRPPAAWPATPPSGRGQTARRRPPPGTGRSSPRPAAWSRRTRSVRRANGPASRPADRPPRMDGRARGRRRASTCPPRPARPAAGRPAPPERSPAGPTSGCRRGRRGSSARRWPRSGRPVRSRSRRPAGAAVRRRPAADRSGRRTSPPSPPRWSDARAPAPDRPARRLWGEPVSPSARSARRSPPDRRAAG